jgi:hypothetical protein
MGIDFMSWVGWESPTMRTFIHGDTRSGQFFEKIRLKAVSRKGYLIAKNNILAFHSAILFTYFL